MSEENKNYEPQTDEENVSINCDPSSEDESVEESGKKPLDVKKIGIISAAAALVIIIAVLLIVLLGGKTPENNDDEDDGGSDAGYVEEKDPERDEFITALGGVSETFLGAVSEESYESAKDAAEAFVTEELSGESHAVIESVQSKGELSKSEIDNLGIPSEILEGSDSVEKLEVNYSIEEAAPMSRAASENDGGARVVVYVIKYGVDWKYFSPRPVNGDTINKSYYDSVFNYEKYKNCTMTMAFEQKVTASAQGETYSMVQKIEALSKFSEGKIYMEQTMTDITNGVANETKIFLYVEETEDGTMCYVKKGADQPWMKASLISVGYTNIEQLTPFYDQYLDYTYFTKRSYGFALADENARKYFSDALMAELEGVVEIDNEDTNIDMLAEYFVSGGVLSGMRLNASVDMSVHDEDISGSISVDCVNDIKCTNYGTTVIERPIID